MTTRIRLQCAVSAVAVAAVALHHFWPAFRGDAFTGAFLLVAVLPWLAPLLKTIKLPGGFEVELRELREELDQTKGAVASAAIQAQVGAAALSAPAPATGSHATVEAQSSPAEFIALGTRYEQVRNSMAPGSPRTEAMTRVVAEMLKAAASIRELDIRPLIASSSRGERLAGITYAHEHPASGKAEPLVASLTNIEDTPFGQYWALRALRRIAGVDPRVFAGRLCERLLAYRKKQKPGTDRYYEVTELLREARCTPKPTADPYGF